MNPRLDLLHPYPFERLRKLFSGVKPNPEFRPINLSIGEPKHATPQFIRDALIASLDGLASYPQTLGRPALRAAIAEWLEARYGIAPIDPVTRVIPTLGSREALFALAQVVLDSSERDALVICPNPFYQIYEGAALLAGATPYFVNTTAATGWRIDWSSVPAEVWPRVRLVFTCSPANPSGGTMTLEEWRELFALSDDYGFVIAADECYTEIYFDEARPPLGGLEAAHQLGRATFPRLVVLGSLSKRSNVPGMRSGFAAGDVELIRKFILYRTYHGSAMSPVVQAASEAAWRDELHVLENRRLYREKFDAFYAIVNPLLPLTRPPASFYYWVQTPLDDEDFAQRLLRETNVTVLPGSYLGREVNGVNPGANYVRIALVSTVEESAEAARRMANFIKTL